MTSPRSRIPSSVLEIELSIGRKCLCVNVVEPQPE